MYGALAKLVMIGAVIMVVGGAIMGGITILITILPVIIPLSILVTKKHPNYGLIKNLKALGWKQKEPFIALGVIAGSGVAIAWSVITIYKAGSHLAGGETMLDDLFVMTMMSGVGYGAWYFFDEVNKGNIMAGIFEMMQKKNADAVSAYLAKREQGPKMSLPSLHIDASIAIPKVMSRIIGQNEIVKSCVTMLGEKASWGMDDKPLGVALFVGPTGTGKSEMAKAIADECFEGRLIEFSMNQFQSAESAAALFGPPPGFLGADKGGQLTAEIMQKGSSVILLDEIEKAHPDVLVSCMQLLDNGMVKDNSSGLWANATRCLIILTSNAEHAKLTKLTETISNKEQLTTQIRKTLEPVFKKPEILARIQDYYVFKKLGPESLVEIIAKMIGGKAKKIGITVNDFDSAAIINILERQEKQSEFGMRVLNNLIDRDIIPGLYRANRDGYKHVEIGIEISRIEGEEDKLTVTGVNPEVESATQSQSTAHQAMTREA